MGKSLEKAKMNEIKFVYFDVGGVTLLDFSGTNKWLQMKRDLGITKELDSIFDRVWKKHRSRICIDCDVDTIISEFIETTGVNIPEKYSMLDDFVNRFDINYSIHPVINEAKDKYRVGLLTNMFPRMFEGVVKRNLIPDIEWNAIVDSSKVGFQKPDEGIFEIAEKQSGVNSKEIFFVDNGIKHVEAAMKRGWQTMLYDPQKTEESSKELSERLGLA